MKKIYKLICCIIVFSIGFKSSLVAQTDIDGITMDKNFLCTGAMYGSSNWDNYWEGTFKRGNANLGTVSSKMYSVMGNYGITNRLNFIFSLPYVTSKASAGQLQKMSGLQDVSLWLKYVLIKKQVGKGNFNLFTIGGLSFPASNYVADYLPLSIGMHSTNLSSRLMADYQYGKWFGTASATYIHRGNVTIDRNAYYTTEQHYTNQVAMPNQTQINLRAGFRTKFNVAELVFNRTNTKGGFDISKNNMPFLSNTMNSTTVGFNGKWHIPNFRKLAITGGTHYTVAGRNVGQTTSYNAGLFYNMDFNCGRKQKATTQANSTAVL